MTLRLGFYFVVSYSICAPTSALFIRELLGRCKDSRDRCFFNFGFVMHRGTANTPDCQEICTLFPVFAPDDATCGFCVPPISPPNLSPTVDSQFNIELDLTQVPLEDRIFFRQARNKWNSVFSAGLEDMDSSLVPSSLMPILPCRLPSVIDDLYICVRYDTIDGSGNKNGNIVASANPVFARASSANKTKPGLPVTGQLKFDIDDINALKDAGIFVEAIRHELAHVLGFGTALWNQFALVKKTDNVNDCSYIGEKARSEYERLTGCKGGIPLTVGNCGHWKKTCFGRELMTETIGLGPILSKMTISTLDDMGYSVDYSQAESYSRALVDFTCRCSRRLSGFGEEGSLHSKKSQHTTLTEEGYQIAFEYGHALLEEAEIVNRSRRKATQGDIMYVADQFTFVLVEQYGSVYSVFVQR